jgi:hypothetical protein
MIQTRREIHRQPIRLHVLDDRVSPPPLLVAANAINFTTQPPRSVTPPNDARPPNDPQAEAVRLRKNRRAAMDVATPQSNRLCRSRPRQSRVT